MIEARQSPVDGLWRAWAEIERSYLGEITREDVCNGVPDLPRWVCLAVARRKWDAIHQALEVVKTMTPQRLEAAE